MMKDKFRKISTKVSNAAGSAWAFGFAVIIIGIWASSGPLFDFSDTWQLVINTGTTIVTFMMVFLIQSTQNRDSRAMQLKLDELIRATRARDRFIDIEDLSDDELALVAAEFRKLPATTEDPALKKFHGKLERVLTKRRSLPGEEVASQVVGMLNPFADRSENDHHGKKK